MIKQDLHIGLKKKTRFTHHFSLLQKKHYT